MAEQPYLFVGTDLESFKICLNNFLTCSKHPQLNPLLYVAKLLDHRSSKSLAL
jgi:hypothetical protein